MTAVKPIRFTAAACSAVLLLIGFSSARAATSTLENVKREGILKCGVTQSGPGLASQDEMGQWRGFFPDFCRVVAAAVTGDAGAVEFYHLDVLSRFTALLDGQVDLVVANTTWTASRDAGLDIDFPVVLYYDGASFMADPVLGATSLKDVEQATVCVNDNTTTLASLKSLIADEKPGFKPLPMRSLNAQIDAFSARKCDLMMYDRIGLQTRRLDFPSPRPVLFPEILSKEPLGPVIRDNDPEWADAVRWSVFAAINAEELNLTSRNITHHTGRHASEIARFLDKDGHLAQALDLPRNWSFNIVKQVGNYGEIFARNIGEASPYEIPRGLNASWRDGGLLYAPPMK